MSQPLAQREGGGWGGGGERERERERELCSMRVLSIIIIITLP
jgi:hypothetical protein